MTRTKTKLAALVLLLAAAGSARATAIDLQRRVVEQDGWSAWQVPMVKDAGTPCCLDWHDHSAVQDAACDLDGRGWNFARNDDDPRPHGAQNLTIYVHSERGSIDKVRAFAASCRVRHADRVRRLDGVSSADSIALLAAGANRASTRDAADIQVAALALHADPGATSALSRLADAGHPHKLREQALFWLGVARGGGGAKIVEQVAAGSDDPELRANAVFDLSQSRGIDAYASIRRIARNDHSGHVRSQALFWMAQMGDKRAKDDIFAALAREPSDKVRQQAVFALSQLDHGEGDAALIALVRGDYPRKVKQQALFWLGQSGSDTALAFLDDVLTRSDAGTPGR